MFFGLESIAENVIRHNVLNLVWVWFVAVSGCERTADNSLESEPAVKVEKTADRETDNDMEKKIVRTEQQWRQVLTPEQYRVLRKKGTEQPFTGKYDNFSEKGVFVCAGCGNELF